MEGLMGNTTQKTNTKATKKADFNKAFDEAVKNSGKAAPPKEEKPKEPAKAKAENKKEAAPEKSEPLELKVVKEAPKPPVEETAEKVVIKPEVQEVLNPIPSLYLVYYDGDLSLTTNLGEHIRDGLMGDLEPDEAKEALGKIKLARLVEDSLVQGDGEEIEWEEAEDLFEVEVAKWTLGSKSEQSEEPEEDDLEDEDLEDEDEEEGEED